MASIVDIRDAKTRLSRLFVRRERGRQIVIACPGRPIAVLAAVTARRAPCPEPVERHVPARLATYRLKPLSVTVEHALRVAGLPPIYGDPFGRLLIAQTQVVGLPISTADAAIGRHGVGVIW